MLATGFLATTYINSTGDIRRARQASREAPADSKIYISNFGGGTTGGSLAAMIGPRAYLDVLEKRFADALKAWDAAPQDIPERRLRQLEARGGIQVLAGQGGVAKSECEQTRTLLEARLAERPEDGRSLIGLAWAYVCLGRNADAVRVARQAADSLPI